MPDAVKPEICLTGTLLYPVHIGLPAYIQETDGCRRTSTVCAILADTQEAILAIMNGVYSAIKPCVFTFSGADNGSANRVCDAFILEFSASSVQNHFSLLLS